MPSFQYSTRMSALTMESNHLNEDHERLMERHSTLLQEMAAKEKSSRDKHDQLLKLANQAERARQDAVANLQQETEALRQSYRVRFYAEHLIIQIPRFIQIHFSVVL